MTTAPSGLEYTGLRELNTYLKRIGVPDDAIKTAMNDAGNVVVREAWRIMPTVTGAMAKTLKANKSKSLLRVQVGNNTTVRYAYTMHAVALGKSKGGFTFRVPPHTRKGKPVRGYTAQRYIPNRPFLFVAFERKKQALYESYVSAIGALIRGASSG